VAKPARRSLLKTLIFFSTLPWILFATNATPWEGELGQSIFTLEGRYEHCSGVDDAAIQKPLWSRILSFDLETFLEKMVGELELEIAKTPPISGLRNINLQGKFFIWDDLSGDPLSASIGINVRYVRPSFLQQPLTPYHGPWDFFINGALGKEWSREIYFISRLFGFLSLGQASRGSPWSQLGLVNEWNWRDRHRLQGSLLTYLGWGAHSLRNLSHFSGYNSIAHRSIDLSLRYTFLWKIWGMLSVEGGYRVYARFFPENFYWCSLSYTLPFTFF
jgi:hypothetical protein